MTKETVAKAISALSLATGYEYTLDEIRLWHSILTAEQISDSAFKRAVQKYIAFGKSYGKPKLSDVLTAGKITPASEKEVARTEAIRVLQHLKKYGAHVSYESSHPITQRLLKGRFELRYVGRTLTEINEKWFIEDFIEAFESSLHMEDINRQLSLIHPPCEAPSLPEGISVSPLSFGDTTKMADP